MDLDLALIDDSTSLLTDQNTSDEKRDKKRWERSNRLCLMIIKKAVLEGFRETMSETTVTAKEFLQDIKKLFVMNEKTEISTLLTRLVSMKYSGEIPEEINNLHFLEYLYLHDNQIMGSIPANIFNISSLRVISLKVKKLNGTIPENMCHRLPNLEGLYLYGNLLHGQMPTGLLECLALQEFTLEENELTGTIPRAIGNLTFLTRIYLGHNKFTGKISQGRQSSKLEDFSLIVNSITGPIPVEIFNISTLVILSLVGNHLSGNLPSSMGSRLPNLETVYLSLNDLDGVIAPSISNASKLAYLNLSNNKFSGLISMSLGGLKHLKKLDFMVNNLTSEPSSSELSFIASLTNCKNLTRLGMNDNPLNGSLPLSIGNLSASLERIYAYNCEIRGNIPQGLENLSSLVILTLSKNRLTRCFATSIEGFQDLQGISLNENLLTGTASEDICTSKSLYNLYLHKNQIFGSLPSCTGNMTSLRYLSIAENSLNSSIPTTVFQLLQ
nr:LRR receptor-like serine/threonine-protein kinase GSO1 [Coffea arabica]